MDHKKDKNEWKPLWQQEVYDDKGRRRFHGAFTGGWSAGYFNTVGSKEGWTPATFRSSRTSRYEGATSRPEDFMDEEDLADARGDRPLQTRQEYGSSESRDPLLSVFGSVPAPSAGLHARTSHKGQALLQQMGWKQGQGLGPLVGYERRAQLCEILEALHLAPPHMSAPPPPEASQLRFPPPDTQDVTTPSNTDRRGLGAAPPSRASALSDALSQFHAAKSIGTSAPYPRRPRHGLGR